MLLHVLRHVELHHGGLVTEQELGERLRGLGLSDSGRPEEDERARRTLRVLEAGTRAPDGLRHRVDRGVLADDPLVQLLFHAQELRGLFFGELVDGDARPEREHFGDRLFGHLVEEVDALGAPFGFLRLALLEELLLLVAQVRGALELLRLDRALLLAPDARDLVFEIAVVGRCLHATDAQARTGLVDEVDRLVGKVAVGDVAVGEVGRGDDRLVGDRDAVVSLVAVAQTLQDLDRVRDGGLLDLDRLEPPLERRVLLEVLAVLVERRRTDGLQLTAGEHRLEDRRRVDRTFGRAGTDEGVQLVDEEDDVAARADLLQHLLQALFEVAAVTRAGDERAEVEGVELLRVQRLGNVVVDDVLRETFDDRGLADTGLADEHRVVLGAAAQHLHDPLDLLLTTDDGIELLVACELREIAAELVEHERTRRLVLRRTRTRRTRAGALLATGVAGEQLDHLLADAGEIGAQLHEHLRGNAFAFANEAEEDVLGADVVVTELQRLAQRELEDLLGTGREGDVTGRSRSSVTDDLLDLRANGFERDAERLEGLRRDAFALVDQSEQDVLGTDVVVIEKAGLLLREDDHPSGSVGEALEHSFRLSWVGSGLVRPAQTRFGVGETTGCPGLNILSAETAVTLEQSVTSGPIGEWVRRPFNRSESTLVPRRS